MTAIQEREGGASVTDREGSQHSRFGALEKLDHVDDQRHESSPETDHAEEPEPLLSLRHAHEPGRPDQQYHSEDRAPDGKHARIVFAARVGAPLTASSPARRAPSSESSGPSASRRSMIRTK